MAVFERLQQHGGLQDHGGHPVADEHLRALRGPFSSSVTLGNCKVGALKGVRGEHENAILI